MRIYRAEDFDDLSRKAANFITAQVLLKPKSIIGLATGSTPMGAYHELIKRYKARDVSFAEARIVNLDEYVGLAPDHEQSYNYYLHNNFLNHIDVRKENIYLVNGSAKDYEAECDRYDKIIEEMGGSDLQILGMGHNGHFAFNEPADIMEYKTHIVDLTPRTVEANKRFFTSEEEVPRQAFTVGAGSIFTAKLALMLVSGKDKAEILKRALYGPITPQVPASLLQMHPNYIVIADKPALSLIE